MMEDLIKAYEDRGVKFWVENGQLKFKAPSGTLNAEDKVKLRNVKEKLIEYYERKDKSALKADLSKRYEPFPLTGIQSAYLLGRNHIMNMAVLDAMHILNCQCLIWMQKGWRVLGIK